MLRHYDKIGLLKPAFILENGYRAYTSGQIGVISKIRMYQSCHFSLSEISELLRADEDTVRDFAKEKIAKLRTQEKGEQFAWAELARLSQATTTAFENRYDISFVQQSEQRLFCCTLPVLERDIESAIESLYNALRSVQVEPSGLLLLLSDLDGNAAYHVAVPVSCEIKCEEYKLIHMEAAWYLATFHFGDYYGIGMAYDRLLCHAAENAYKVTPPFIERYFVDAEHAISPTQYITQILVKITP